jgi:hypothetical protein
MSPLSTTSLVPSWLTVSVKTVKKGSLFALNAPELAPSSSNFVLLFDIAEMRIKSGMTKVTWCRIDEREGRIPQVP